ncbi:hypothetical protein LJJ44_01575 [Pseudomonas sp. B24_DOA]|nr:hypothetical protein LJJ44_01575 [Pseudomonas sp. B24_DOA]WKV90398.1 hypothetical protein LJU32_09610 [Pseudomonas sp. B21_DOA]
MSTSTAPTFDEIRSDLNQIGHHFFNLETALLPEQKTTTEQACLNRINGLLKSHREQFVRRSRALYQALADSDLESSSGKSLLADLKKTSIRHCSTWICVTRSTENPQSLF